MYTVEKIFDFFIKYGNNHKRHDIKLVLYI